MLTSQTSLAPWDNWENSTGIYSALWYRIRWGIKKICRLLRDVWMRYVAIVRLATFVCPNWLDNFNQFNLSGIFKQFRCWFHYISNSIVILKKVYFTKVFTHVCYQCVLQWKFNGNLKALCAREKSSDMTDYYHKSQYTNRNSYKAKVSRLVINIAFKIEYSIFYN